jgi:CheY-like chemotaxis protein
VPIANLLVAVVDDEPAVCKAIERLLRSCRFDVMTFAGGAAFISSLSSRKPDCVVLDINMPGMSGFDVRSRLASDPATQNISIVMITGVFPEIEQRIKADQSILYLRKPFDKPALLEAIRTVVAGKHE